MTDYRYRNIPVGTADNGLSSDAKALYFSVYTSSEMNLCGVLFTSRSRLAKMAGIRSNWPGRKLARVDRALRDLGAIVMWWPELNIIFIPGFAKMQAANPNIWVGAMRNASNLPKQVASIVQKSIMSDFRSSVSSDKPYYAKTVEKLERLTVPEHQVQLPSCIRKLGPLLPLSEFCRRADIDLKQLLFLYNKIRMPNAHRIAGKTYIRGSIENYSLVKKGLDKAQKNEE